MAGALSAAIIVLLFLVLMPETVVPGKYPRFKVSPRTKKQLRGFFKDHSSDMVDFSPNGGGRGGRSQAPATKVGMYLYSFDVGTPAQRVSAALDITDNFVWLQCGAVGCDVTSGCLVTVATPFLPSQSRTAADVPCTNRTCQMLVPQRCGSGNLCSYTLTYGDGAAHSTGVLGNEAFTFGGVQVDGVVFGCGVTNVGVFAGGAIGLGRGPFSLVSQLGAGRFSYHFAPDDSAGNDSFILFGGDAAPMTSRALSTPLLASRANPKFYYVGLSGIQVDGNDLPIPRGTFDLRTDGSGGVVLSITIPATLLDEVAYKLVRQALVSKIGLPTVDGLALGLDLCYTSQSLAARKIPSLALVFDDGNAVMELETWNYFFMDATTGLECLTIVPSPAGGGSLLGNLIQAGTHMIYDINGSMLHFESLQQESTISSAPPLLQMLHMVVANLAWAVVYML
jgi:hypothetical protein